MSQTLAENLQKNWRRGGGGAGAGGMLEAAVALALALEPGRAAITSAKIITIAVCLDCGVAPTLTARARCQEWAS